MKLKYYGTSAAEGWPGLFCRCDACCRARALGGKNLRTRAQATVDDALLLDFGPDTNLHIVRDGLPLHEMHACLMTHTHEDHLQPMELLWRTPPYAHEVRGDFTLYGNEEMMRILENLHKTYGKQVASIQGRQMADFAPASVEDYVITAMPACHDRRQRCLIYIVERDGKRLLYAHDTGIFSDRVWEYIAGMQFDCVSLDCTMGLASEGSNHMGIPDILRVRDKMAQKNCIGEHTVMIASHFSHNTARTHEELEAILRPEGFLTAYDGMEVVF